MTEGLTRVAVFRPVRGFTAPNFLRKIRSGIKQHWWRRRELNPRPKMLLAERLHA